MRLLTVKDVSEMLNVKVKTIYQWAELNQIPHMKLNGVLRFDLNDIMAWIQRCKKQSSSSYNLIVSHQARSPKRRCN